MPSRDDGRMVLVLEGRRAKVDQMDVGSLEDLGHLDRLVARLRATLDWPQDERRVAEEDVLRLQVLRMSAREARALTDRVHELVLVQKLDAPQELPREALDMAHREGLVVVVLQVVEDRWPEQVGDEADVIPIVKVFAHVDALPAR